MSITPVLGEANWSYAVDVDGDGAPDRTGSLTGRVVIPYRFEEVGPHAIDVRLTMGTREESIQEIVVVNDPDAISVAAVADLPGVTLIEGIAVDPGGDRVYVGLSIDREIAEMDATTLDLLRVVDPAAPHNNTFEGLATAGDPPVLYIIDKFGALQALEIPSLETVFNRNDGYGRFFVVPRNGRIYTGGGVGVARVDAETGQILARHQIPTGIGHFAVAPGEDLVALLVNTDLSNAVHLLAANDFSLRWTLELAVPDPIPSAVAFSPDGDRLYVLLDRNPFRLLVLEVETGTILRDFVLTGLGCPECNRGLYLGVANPVATTADGRYVVFPTAIGAFFVDTARDLPVFRTPDPLAWGAVFCCNVAASPTESDVVYVADLGNRVFKLRIRDGMAP